MSLKRLALWGAIVAALLPWPARADHVHSREDIAAALDSVVGIRAEVPADARSAATLGRVRQGSGVVIGADGLILTIGYLILEAETIEVMARGGGAVPATPVAYDHDTGFGLVRTAVPVGGAPLRLGDSSSLAVGAPAIVVSFGGATPLTPARVVDRRPFAGYWEYLLEDAIFTAPPHLEFGGAALIGGDGHLMGIGSLFVGDAMGGSEPLPGNMFVPVDALKPILAQLVASGRRGGPSRPWIGVTLREYGGRVVLFKVSPGGPAEAAGLKAGDVVMGVGGRPVKGLQDFLRRLGDEGPAGAAIPLDVVTKPGDPPEIDRVVVPSRDRMDWIRRPKGY